MDEGTVNGETVNEGTGATVMDPSSEGFTAESKPGETTVVSWRKLLNDVAATNGSVPPEDDDSDTDADDADRYIMVDLRNSGCPIGEPTASLGKRSRKDAGKSPGGGEDGQNPKPGKKARKSVKIDQVKRKTNTLLEKAIKELETLVAESRPQSEESKRRILPDSIKQKLAQVAKASRGEISSNLVDRLMGIVGHLVQLRTLKRNLKSMVDEGLSVKKDVAEKMERKAEAPEKLNWKPESRRLKKRLFDQLEVDSGVGSREDEEDVTLLSILKSCNKGIVDNKVKSS